MKGILSALIWCSFWIFVIIFTLGLGIVPFAATLFLIFAGSVAREDRAYGHLSSTLMRDEVIYAQAIQKRIFALWHRRATVGITNSRILLISRGLLGGFTMKDIQWKDLTDAKLKQNVLSDFCGSDITFLHNNGGVGALEVLGIDSGVAAEIYSRSQEEEQAWEEKRRIRGMEESRAKSGGVYVNTAPVGQPSAEPTPALLPERRDSNRMLEEIERAKSLLDSGIISDSEFQEMKSKIISAM